MGRKKNKQMSLDETVSIIKALMSRVKTRGHLTYLIDRVLRLSGSYHPTRASVKAQKVADSMGIGDLSQYDWGDQPKRMRDKGRKIFHHEHITPLKAIIKDIVKCKKTEDIEKHVLRVKIAWILKEEDDKLNVGIGGSWRSERPDDAYERLGIDLV